MKGHLVLGKVSVPELPLKSMWKASIRKSGPTNAKIATMAPELRLTMLNTVFPNMVPGWSTVRPRSLWITLAKNARKFARPSLPSEAYPEGQMYAAEEISVPTVPKIVEGECKERHPHPDIPQSGRSKDLDLWNLCQSFEQSSAHINHQLWHRGLTAQRRACRIRERNLQVQMFKIQQKALAKKAARLKKSAADAPSKSAPPKLIPGARRSPRLSRGGKGGRGGKGAEGGKGGKK